MGAQPRLVQERREARIARYQQLGVVKRGGRVVAECGEQRIG